MNYRGPMPLSRFPRVNVIVRSLVPVVALSLAAAAQAAPWPSAAPIEQQLVNINTATARQLAFLPGVGEKTADRILVYRQAHRFTKPADLCAAGLPRFTGKTCAAVLPYVIVSGPTTATAPIRARSSRQALRDVWVCAEDGADVSCDLYEADGSLATTVRLPKSASIGSLFPVRKAVR